MRYKIPIVCLTIYCIVALMPAILQPEGDIPFTTIVPGTYRGIQITILMYLALILVILFGISFGYVTAPIYLFVHKYLIGHKMVYGINQRQRPEKFKKNFRGFFPTLMAFNFAIVLTPILSKYLLTSEMIARGPPETTFWAFLVIAILILGPITGIFAGSWFLNDAGIGYSNMKKVKDTDDFIEIRSVGGWYLYFLKGFAGIGVIFSFYLLITNFLSDIGALGKSSSDYWLEIFMVIPIPIYGTLAILPTIVILDLISNQRKKFILRIAKKMGINNPLEYKVD
ncbi:MAG TPA: hypothetical protein VGB37_12230 [Candidatus Lokiarchaeia archaeon]